MSEINWQDFHFLRPAFLWLLIPAILVLWRWLHQSSGKDGWQQHCDPNLLAAMQTQSAQKASRWQWLYWPVVIIAILAMAGPAVRQIPVPVVQNQAALVLAMDVSRSMLADDIKPSRLQRAKFKIQDLLAERKDGQTALIAYAGDAFVVTPLTNDIETITALLDAIEPSIMPVKGTNTPKALQKSAELLSQAGLIRGEVLLITDSIAMHKTEPALSQLKDQNITTHVMAVGTREGSPIPTPRGFVKDLQGQIVIPQVDFSELQSAASAGGGHFTVLSSGDDFAGMFDTDADQDDEDYKQQDDMNSANYIDDGPLLAVLLLPLLALMYRRGLLLFLAVGVVIPVEQSHAVSWDDLWLNKDQQAWKKLQSAEAAEAQKLAENPQLQAAAAYENKQFKQAADLYQNQVPDLDKYYNQGNALAQAGELEQALASYEQALALNPEDEDTLYNKKIVEDALKQQQEQQQNEQGEQGDESDQNQQGDQQQQEQQEGEEQNQEQQSEQEQNAEEQEQSEEEQQQQEGEEQEQQSELEEVELTPEEQALDAEEKQAMEQWLRRIKDDPGGLLRRKFLYQYHRRNQDGDDYQTTEDW